MSLNSQERWIVAFVIALGIILTSISVSSKSVCIPILSGDTSQLSSEVWSDDFENVTISLDEWTFDGWAPPNVTVSDGFLYSDGPDRNYLSHNSTTALGTWSLDLYFPDQTDYWVWIVFMSPQWSDLYNSLRGYLFNIDQRGSESQSFELAYLYPDLAGAFPMELDQVEFDFASDWLHIDVTRQTDKWMYVFLNGTMILQANDSKHSTSEYFRLVSSESVVFDNVAVSDTVDIDGVPPHWTEPLINHTINAGEDFSHALFADDYSGLDTWWVDESSNFAVDNEGVVTTLSRFSSGIHSVEVNVNDTFGNVLSGTFSVEVLPWVTNTTTSPTTNTGPNPLNPITIALFGAVGVAWFVAVLFIIRDYRTRKNASG